MSRSPLMPILAALAMAWLGSGCGDFGVAGERCVDGEGGACDEDMGPDSGFTGGSGDAGAPPDATAPPSAPEGIPATDGTSGLAAGESADSVERGAGSCYDGVDNDDTSAADCDDSGCVELGSCCVGHGDCCASLGAAAPLPPALSFDGSCDGDPVASCLSDDPVTAFGDPGPWVREGMLHPGGDASYDSGLVVGEPVDLGAMRVELTTTFGTATECSGTCLEGAGVAFTDQEVLDDTTHVRPLVGLLASGRGDVSLVVSDEVVASWSLGETDESWTLVLRPTGRVEVFRAGEDDALETTAHFPAASDARLVLYGRNRNPMADAPDGARIGALTLTTLLCDMPTAWRSRDELFVAQPPLTGALDTGSMRGASVDFTGERLSMVFEDGGNFMFAQRVPGDDTRFALAHAAGDPVLEPGRPWDEGGIHDPELVWNGTKHVLFYSAVDGTDGTQRIGRAVSDVPGGEFSADEEPLLSPESPVVGYAMPTVVRLPRAPTLWIMAVRAELEGGGHQLRLLVSEDDGETFLPYDGGLAGLTTRGTGLSMAGFDADEIADPSLVVHNGAYHLYYAGRRGTRWRIGMLASDELVHWRAIEDGGPVLAGDGNGPDRVGVRHPGAWAEDGEVELFYTGNDGARDTLMRAVRMSTAGGSR